MRFSILAGLMAIQGSCQAAYLKRPSNEQVSRVTNTSTSVRDQLDSLADAALTAANLLAIKDAAANKTTCTKENMQVRKEWGSLSEDERLGYVAAVQCLMKLPPKTPTSLAPGAKSRYDDFQVTHMNQTLAIHNTANFLVWHRYYIWLYEEALRNECGFNGSFPYWDWSLTAESGLEKSPLFDGSPTSLSGNGDPIPRNGSIVLGGQPGLDPIIIPTGSGGGCVTTGPFAGRNLTLGPVRLSEPGNVTVGKGDGLADNPRCWKRDLNNYVNQAFGNATSVLNNLVQPDTINAFQTQLQGKPGASDLGIHGSGHYAIGGDPASDPYTSPGDPSFYPHHAMVDRVWWMWQMQDPEVRVYSDKSIDGTITFMNQPPSRKGNLDDVVEYGFAAGPERKIRDLQSTTSGPFCYVYE